MEDLLRVMDIRQSEDGSIKYAFENSKGNKLEAVYFSVDGILGRKRRSIDAICLSSQAGCVMGCTFCATGLGGFFGNLTTKEMLEEVAQVRKDVSERGLHAPTCYTLMGMGEPLLNVDNVMEFYSNVRNNGPKIDPLSLSTIGIIPSLERLIAARDVDYKIFFSLHSPYNEERSRIMPINKVYPLEKVLDKLREYGDAKGRRSVVSYLLLDGVNDDEQHALDLAKLLDEKCFDVQLLLFNPIDGIQFKRPQMETAERFKSVLLSQGLFAYIQISKGRDIAAGCGQLIKDIRKKERKA